jgi:hypothetical protein
VYSFFVTPLSVWPLAVRWKDTALIRRTITSSPAELLLVLFHSSLHFVLEIHAGLSMGGVSKREAVRMILVPNLSFLPLFEFLSLIFGVSLNTRIVLFGACFF